MPRESDTMLASNIVRPGTGALKQDGELKRSLAPVLISNKPNPLRREINLLLSVEDGQAGKGYRSETINVAPGETIQGLKMRLRSHSFFTNRHCLVFGERALMESETIGQVIARTSLITTHSNPLSCLLTDDTCDQLLR